MQRIAKLDAEKTEGKTRELLDGVKAKAGRVANIYATMAGAPAVLETYLAQNAALARAGIGGKLRERLAITVAAFNGCEYCASAHTAGGRSMKVEEEELSRALTGSSADPKVDAALKFALALLRGRGRVSDEEFAALRAVGYPDAQIMEIIAAVGANIFSNYFNLAVGTELDFPRVALPPPLMNQRPPQL